MIILIVATIALFGGEGLSGWVSRGDTDWSVEDGVLIGSGAGQGFFLTNRDYGDFRLRLEFWIDVTTNSGVFIRCRDRNRIHPETCYELNIWDEHPRQAARTGAIVLKAMPPLAHVTTVNRWNSMEVLADGERIDVAVNGELTATLVDANPQAGFIALQHWESGIVKFRNMTLTLLER